MQLRQMAVALLFNEQQEILFLQKKTEATFLSGHLVPVGGHLEEQEITDPQKACLREIAEETGLTSHSINDLSLRYIIHRVKENREIRIQYIFIGRVVVGSRILESDEGRLMWVNGSALNQYPVTASTREVIAHYLETGIHNKQLYTGTMHSVLGEPAIQWAILQDWERQVIE
ncbi:NUDIX domain-containing protein [Paenibacillus tritici]|uniref:NUDIX domain-containing protein n=1 Tax=Paenibacillus tritici TaxID=1873425 RepID=UPI001BAC1BFF|nr:NUDIX domain-containing protein [Paenibacillus tritici]QUL55819.1 NUDIX domain-containing protein [Paenibacillus tritici]